MSLLLPFAAQIRVFIFDVLRNQNNRGSADLAFEIVRVYSLINLSDFWKHVMNKELLSNNAIVRQRNILFLIQRMCASSPGISPSSAIK